MEYVEHRVHFAQILIMLSVCAQDRTKFDYLINSVGINRDLSSLSYGLSKIGIQAAKGAPDLKVNIGILEGSWFSFIRGFRNTQPTLRWSG